MRRVLAIVSGAAVLAVASCGPPMAVGTTTMLEGGRLLAPESARPGSVSLVFGEPGRSYSEIARVSASASTLDFGSMPAAEAAALEQLRMQAAIAEADAVLFIERQVYDTGAWITYDEDFFGDRYFGRDPRDDRFHDGPAFRSGTARERRDLEVNFRGTAVRYRDGVR